jgi:transposase
MAGRIGVVFDQAEIMQERLRCHPGSQEPANEAGKQPANEAIQEPAHEAVEPSPVPASRWTLARIRQTFAFLHGYSLPGVSKYLHASGIKLRHGRPQYFSPDPAYQQKESALLAALEHVGREPGKAIGLFLDEMSYTRWPDASTHWCQKAPAPRPVADRKKSRSQRYRLVGALNATSGQVNFLQTWRVSGEVFSRFLRQLDQAYQQGQTIYLIWDNWPVHHSQVVKETLATLPRLQVINLPTYAPWLNAIEKLWRKFRQEIDDLHEYASDGKRLRERVQAFFAQFAHGSADLLRYVGLSGNGKLAVALQASP